MIRRPPIVGRAGLDLVRLGALLADALAHARCSAAARMYAGHQDDDDARTPAGCPGSSSTVIARLTGRPRQLARSASTSEIELRAARRLDQHDVAVAQPDAQEVEAPPRGRAASRIARRVEPGRQRAPSAIPAAPAPTTTSRSHVARPRASDLAWPRRAPVAELEHLAEDGDRGARAGRRAGPARR